MHVRPVYEAKGDYSMGQVEKHHVAQCAFAIVKPLSRWLKPYPQQRCYHHAHNSTQFKHNHKVHILHKAWREIRSSKHTIIIYILLWLPLITILVHDAEVIKPKHIVEVVHQGESHRLQTPHRCQRHIAQLHCYYYHQYRWHTLHDK